MANSRKELTWASEDLFASAAHFSCTWSSRRRRYRNRILFANTSAQVVDDVEAMKKRSQVMNDMVFSFAELGFQEFETSKYLTEILEKEGFAVERGIAGIPTAWMATWGSGKPVIALGSDIDCIPKASQKPGVARHEPLVDGAPGPRRGS